MHFQGFLAAMSPGHPYRLDTVISKFFAKTATNSTACDKMAIGMVGGRVEPVAVQGNCSYTVYAGCNLEYVFQFRLSSLPLDVDVLRLAHNIHGSIVPEVTTYGQLGGVHAYSMRRIPGISYLDFILADRYFINSKESFACRKTLMGDIASFFAASWNSPQQAPLGFRSNLRQEYIKDLGALLQSFPPRFHNAIQRCIDSIDAIVNLPVVLLHRDFSTANLIVDRETCHLKGVLDWGEAGLSPFGQNFHFLQNLMCVLKLPHGWQPYDDYQVLQDTLWGKFTSEARGISLETVDAIKIASVMGLLLYRGFTRRLAGMPHPTPISEDEEGNYSFLYLDAFVLHPTTRIIDLD